MDKSPVLLSGFVTDAIGEILSYGAGTLGAVAGIALSELMKKRAEDAREIALDELRRGAVTLREAGEPEEVVAVLHRYLREAREGRARLNLRLMAKIMAGQAYRGNLVADEFLYYADLVASLRREEVMLVAAVLKHDGDMSRIAAELVPQPFASSSDLNAASAAVTRTGLIYNDNEGLSTTANRYRPSPLLKRLAQLVRFDDALRQEPAPDRFD